MSLSRINTRLVCFVSAAFAVLALPSAGLAQTGCGPLPAPSGFVIDVTPAQAGSLSTILASARSGDTIRLADGTYSLTKTLVFRTAGVTLRSKSGNRAKVILDGRYAIGDVLLIYESNVTIADLTLTRAYHHPVHVVPYQRSSSGILLHNLRLVDGAAQFIKINPANGYYADNGVIRCSSLELTDTGRSRIRNNCYTGGIDAHQARGWRVYANMLSGFWCSSGLSEHAIHFWTGSRDTVVERNLIRNSARGIGFGLGYNTRGRSYSDKPCGGKTLVGHYGGLIANNFVSVDDDRVYNSGYGFDTGIGLEESCQTNVLHNTVASTRAPRSSSIEWRFADTVATIANNLVTHNLLPRQGGTATLGGNVTNAALTLFVNARAGNLHLVPSATGAINRGARLSTPVATDIDGTKRDAFPDVGADEYASVALTVLPTSTAATGEPIESIWTARPSALDAVAFARR